MSRSWGLLLSIGFVAGTSLAEPARVDPGVSPESDVDLGFASFTLSDGDRTFADPFALDRVWLVPGPSAGNLPVQPLHQPLFPQLTLRLEPLAGFEPFFSSQYLAPSFSGSGGLNNDFGFRFSAGPFRAGTRFDVFRDVRGLMLGSTSFARYVTPTYHFGLLNHASFPLTTGSQVTQTWSAAAGVRPEPDAPALRVSSTLPEAGSPSIATSVAGMF